MPSKENIRISFIVPVYNMEKYLNECVDSILSQKIDESEIILIDDGSTDLSSAICDEYVKEDSRIKVVHKANGGISSARNCGIDKASGDYICFMDSDDFYRLSFAKKYLSLCENNDLDIIRGWYSVFIDNEKKYDDHPFPSISFTDKVLTGREFLVRSIEEHSNEVVPWLGFFRREYLLKHRLYFPEGIAYEEDQLFFLEALICDENCRIMQTDDNFYAYRKRDCSATKSPSFKQAEDVLYIVGEEEKLLSKYPALPKKVVKAVKRYICSSFYQLTSIYGRVSKTDKKKIAEKTSFHIKRLCLHNPYDKHQFFKILLFTYCRWFVDMVYERRKKI